MGSSEVCSARAEVGPKIISGAERHKTGDELLQLASTVSPHLPVVNPLLRRILGVVTTLNVSANSLEPDLLIHDVRAVELISRQYEHPDWERSSYRKMPGKRR